MSCFFGQVAKAVGLNNFRGLKEYVLGDQKSAKRREWIPEQVPCSQEILSRIQTRYLEERYQLLEDLKQVDLDGFDLDRFEIEPIVASIISPLIYKHGDKQGILELISFLMIEFCMKKVHFSCFIDLFCSKNKKNQLPVTWDSFDQNGSKPGHLHFLLWSKTQPTHTKHAGPQLFWFFPRIFIKAIFFDVVFFPRHWCEKSTTFYVSHIQDIFSNFLLT